MSGDRIVVDTNIALYLLTGNEEVIEILSGKQLLLSVITRMELLSFPGLLKSQIPAIETFLESWPVETLSDSIEREAIRIRRMHKLKLPDSIIAATAVHLEAPLISADRDMQRLVPEIDVIRYELRGE